MISIILVEPKTSGNVGAIARVMANFDFSELVIINPKCRVDCKEGMDRARHAKKILERAKITDEQVLDDFDYLIGTTARLGTDYNLPRSPLTPVELSKKLSEINARKSKTKIGLMFGREGDGLSNEEIAKCDFTVTIPTSRKYSSMNLSHAVSVILYSISSEKEQHLKNKFPPVTGIQKEFLLENIDEILEKMDFATQEKRETQRILWKKLIGKSMLTKREAQALFGFLKKVKKN